MCGSPRMGVLAGMGGMPGLFRHPGPPGCRDVRFPPYGHDGGIGWYVRIIQTPRSPRWVVCPDYSDAPVPPVAGMCGSPRMGVMAGMGGMPGS
jgi:hypothetical protein